MDLARNLVYRLLEERGLLGDGLFVAEYTGIHFGWTTSPATAVATLFVDARRVDVIVFHHGLLVADTETWEGQQVFCKLSS